MAFEFDCPQYYDFETGMDISNPEAYFESVNNLSPTNCYNSKKSESIASDFPVHLSSEPYKNTRLSLRKSQNSAGFLKSTSKDEPPSKIAKVIPTVTRPISKTPFSTAKGIRTKLPSAIKPLEKRDINLQQNIVKKQLTATVQAPFSFATDKRLKADLAEKSQYKQFDYATTLRTNKENQGINKTGPIRAVPDRLLRKRKTTEKRTLAEEILFQQGRTDYSKPKGAKYLSVTIPVTPYLRTATRSRRANCEEKVTAVAKNIQREKQNLTLPAVTKKTKPAFNPIVNTKDKHLLLRPRPTSPNKATQFKARPVPTRILKGVTGLGVRPQIKLTEAHSPAFVMKKRAEIWKQHETKDNDGKKLESCKRLISTNAPVVAANERNKKMQKDIPKVISGQQKTQSSKFMSELQERARSKANEWQKKMEEEMKQQRDALLFKARPCTVTRSKPFQPVKSNKLPTKTSGFQFQSDLRIQHRKKLVSESEDVERVAVPKDNDVYEFSDEPIKQERLSVSNSCPM